MTKFLKTTLPTNEKSLVSLDIDGKATWVKCTPEVKSYASQNIKPGEVVTITKDDSGTITRLSKGEPVPQPGTTVTDSQKSQDVKKDVEPAPRVHSTTGRFRDPLTPEEARAVRRQTVLQAVCTAVSGGNLVDVDANARGEYILGLYRQFLAELEK